MRRSLCKNVVHATLTSVVGLARELIGRLDHDYGPSLSGLRFAGPVAAVYNPLEYARAMWAAYLERYGNSQRRVVFLGMNPGPWGMAQTGVPFGEIGAVRDWMQIQAPIARPGEEHPKRPVVGLATTRSEVSGRRLWGLFRDRYHIPEAFFTDHIVLNYCPLVFMAESGRNITPDKLSAAERASLFAVCDRMLADAIDAYRPEWIVGVGAFAAQRAESASGRATSPSVVRILHPSPASPLANKGWAERATQQLEEAGVWARGDL